ncbi:MAG: rhodanese-like domain-containing protein [Deinococcus sp.]|nr:rhodanese-like domain-containing protein [Deinococcus sp.]
MFKRMLVGLALAVVVVWGATGLSDAVFTVDQNFTGYLSGVLASLKADSPWGKIDTEDLADLIELQLPFFLMDVRTPEEYAQGFIPGAVNIPLDTLPENLDRLPVDRNTLVVVYCKTGWRANLGMYTMRLLGYTNTKGYEGSFQAWQGAGLPVQMP